MNTVTMRLSTEGLPLQTTGDEIERAIAELAQAGAVIDSQKLGSVLNTVQVRTSKEFIDPDSLKFVLIDCGVATALGIEAFKVGFRLLWPKVKELIRAYHRRPRA